MHKLHDKYIKDNLSMAAVRYALITAPDRTQLNSNGSWVELSWVLKSDHIAQGDVITPRTQLNWNRPVFCQSRQSEQAQNFYNQLSLVIGRCDHAKNYN